MTEVAVVEAPGAVGLVYQCPNCSRSYPSWDVEAGPPATDKDGRQVASVNPPQSCKRCGCPMDINKAQHFAKGSGDQPDKSFGDVQAQLRDEAAADPASSRRTITV